MLIAGIDEAGYGPLLGPLVITGVSMKLPDELDGLSLWELFDDVIAQQAKNANGKFVITDSKKLFRGSGKKNIRELERSALGAVSLINNTPPKNLSQLIDAISLETEPHLLSRWYCHNELTLPVEVDRKGLILAADIFKRGLKMISAELAGVYTVPLVEKKYNHLVSLIKNKSQILFSQTTRIIANIIDNTPERKIKIFIDKQGGRNSYVNNLLKIFGHWQLTVIKESDEQSAYRLAHKNRILEINFTREGEKYNMLTAWASIVSKYVRELFMMQFNKFWCNIDENLKPTAGYWKDGQRFVKDITPLIKQMNIKNDELIRKI